MPETTQCPQCQRKLNVPDAQIGQTVRCPLCGEEFTAAVLHIQRPPPAAPLEREPLPRGREYDSGPPLFNNDEDYRRRGRRGYNDFRSPNGTVRCAPRRRCPGAGFDRHVYVVLHFARVDYGRHGRVDGRNGLAANGSRNDGRNWPRLDPRRSGLRNHRAHYFHVNFLVRLPGKGRPHVIKERNGPRPRATLRGTAVLAPRSWPPAARCNRNHSTPKVPCRFHRGSGRADGRLVP